MTTQLEAFPKTTLEVLTELSGIHRDDLERAVKALDALSDDEQIAKRYDKAEAKVAACRALVAAIDQAVTRERERLTGPGPVPPAAVAAMQDMKHTAEEAGIGLSIQFGNDEPVVIAENPVVDPVTGEVADTGTVTASRPDGDEVETEVGSRTRYGELVADYLAAVGSDEPVNGYQVRGGDGSVRANGMPIQPSDYGSVLTVEAVAS